MFIKKRFRQMQKLVTNVEVECNRKSIAHDPYSCAIKAKHEYFTGWKALVKYHDMFIYSLNKNVMEFMEN